MCHPRCNIKKKNHCVKTSKFWALSFSLEDRQAMLSFSPFYGLGETKHMLYVYHLLCITVPGIRQYLHQEGSLGMENHKLKAL